MGFPVDVVDVFFLTYPSIKKKVFFYRGRGGIKVVVLLSYTPLYLTDLYMYFLPLISMSLILFSFLYIYI